MDPTMIAMIIVAVLVVLASLMLMKPAKKRPVALDPNNKVELALIAKEEISHDTRRFRFALQSNEHMLGLPVGQHIALSYTDASGNEVGRPYTPTSSDKDVGFVDFVIKVYFKGVHPKFPEGGVFSQYMEQMKLGDKLEFQGPKGSIQYKGRGTFAVRRLKSQGGGFALREAKQVGMIAGGTGITPMLQVLEAMLADPSDRTKAWLLYANQTEGDILCRELLERLAKENSGRFKLWYTLDRPPAGWAFSTGFVTQAMMEAHLPAASKATQVLMCGPGPMINAACKPALLKLGFADENFLTW